MQNFKFKKLIINFFVVIFSLGIFASKFFFIPPAEESLGYYPDELPNPQCLDDIYLWSNSTFFNPNANWSISAIPININAGERFSSSFYDINGDGLLDYVYKNNYTSGCNGDIYNRSQGCVLLNNGHGWEVAYRCVVECDGVQPVYYGDCAQL